MNIQTVAAGAVVVGDKIYNATGFNAPSRWEAVKEVIAREGGMVEIKTAIYSEWRDAREGVAIQRAAA